MHMFVKRNCRRTQALKTDTDKTGFPCTEYVRECVPQCNLRRADMSMAVAMPCIQTLVQYIGTCVNIQVYGTLCTGYKKIILMMKIGFLSYKTRLTRFTTKKTHRAKPSRVKLHAFDEKMNGRNKKTYCFPRMQWQASQPGWASHNESLAHAAYRVRLKMTVASKFNLILTQQWWTWVQDVHGWHFSTSSKRTGEVTYQNFT